MPKTLATATVDRLLRHAHLITTQGDSHRLQQGAGRQGGEGLDLTHHEIAWPSPGISGVRLPGAHKAIGQDFVLTLDSRDRWLYFAVRNTRLTEKSNGMSDKEERNPVGAAFRISPQNPRRIRDESR